MPSNPANIRINPDQSIGMLIRWPMVLGSELENDDQNVFTCCAF